MSAVRKLGRFPVEHAVAEDPKLEEERKLAHDIRKAVKAARLPPAFVSELEAMRDKAEEEAINEDKRRLETWAQELMLAVRRFGRWPQRKRGSERGEERELAKRARAALNSGSLTPADEAELSEMRWVHLRELGAAALETKARQASKKKLRQRAQARLRKTRTRSLRTRILGSSARCTCHDFDFWAHIWKRNHAVAKRLRQCCHVATCKLYSPFQNVALPDPGGSLEV